MMPAGDYFAMRLVDVQRPGREPVRMPGVVCMACDGAISARDMHLGNTCYDSSITHAIEHGARFVGEPGAVRRLLCPACVVLVDQGDAPPQLGRSWIPLARIVRSSRVPGIGPVARITTDPSDPGDSLFARVRESVERMARMAKLLLDGGVVAVRQLDGAVEYFSAEALPEPAGGAPPGVRVAGGSLGTDGFEVRCRVDPERDSTVIVDVTSLAPRLLGLPPIEGRSPAH